MKFAMILVCAVAASQVRAAPYKHEKRSADRDEEKRSLLAATAIAGSVISSLGSFFSSINGPDNVKDMAIAGRPMRITADGNCAVVEDRESGYKSTKCGASGAEAASLASEELVTLLIQLGFITKDDLHLPPELVTQPPKKCHDTVGSSKCNKHILLGHCDVGSPFFHWMHENCYRSCVACAGSVDDILNAGRRRELPNLIF